MQHPSFGKGTVSGNSRTMVRVKTPVRVESIRQIKDRKMEET
jgi:hypothetical protein